MKNIYSFLNNVWREILEESKQNKAFIPLLLLLITLPISMAINNFLLGIFFISAFFLIGKKKGKIFLYIFFANFIICVDDHFIFLVN